MAIIKRSGGYGVQVYRGGGRREWVGTYETHAEAKQAEREALAARPTSGGRETWAEFAERWPRDYNHISASGKLRWAPEHLRNLEYALKPFVAEFGHHRVGSFPTAEALPWISARPESVLRAVRSMFNDAVKSQLAPDNPFANLGLERSRGRADIIAITEEELALLADCAIGACGSYGRQVLSPLITFQGYVGTRLIGMANLRPEDVDLGAETVYVRKPGKRVAPRTVVLFPKAREAVSRMPARLGSKWLFTSKTGRKISQTNLWSAWNETRVLFDSKLDPRRAAELSEARPNEDGRMQFHELRHCAATIMARRGVAPADCAFQLCQNDEGDLVKKVYSHLTDEERQLRVRAAFDTPAPHAEPTAREATG